MTSRQVLEIIEIDVDFCDNDFGVSPCTASGAAGTECYNTYATCQDTANFASGTKTLRFSRNQTTGIFGTLVFPAIKSVSTNPTRISLGRTDDKLGSLGKRARVEVVLGDFKWSDRDVDPYAATRTYDVTQGTFFGKLSARFPYYYGRALRRKTGYVGDSLASTKTENYIITEWAQSSSGEVKITAQDPLRLADEKLSQCPVQTVGKLDADISDSATEFTLSESGSGDAEYDASGYVSIGSEIMAFTRSGDVFTLTERGAGGTTASSHTAGGVVQQCYSVENAVLADVIEDLLQDFAGIDAAFLPKSDWESELEKWLASVRLTRIIGQPTPVKTLLGQIADFGIFFWWDEEAAEIKVRVNRPRDYDQVIPDVDDNSVILEPGAAREDLNEQRLSRVYIRHGMVNQLDSVTDPENYRRSNASIDAGKETENEYGQKRILEVFLPWLAQNDAVADAIAARTLNRFKDTPKALGFEADYKDKSSLELAGLVSISTGQIQGVTGANEPEQMQVTQVEETIPGHRLKLRAQTYRFDGRFGYITENARPTYGSSSASQIANGTYIIDETTLLFPDGTGPYILF